MRRPPFLLKPRTWLITAAGALAAVVLWATTANCMGSHYGRDGCHPTETTGEQYGAFAILGAVVGLMGAYVGDAPVRRRPPIEDDL